MSKVLVAVSSLKPVAIDWLVGQLEQVAGLDFSFNEDVSGVKHWWVFCATPREPEHIGDRFGGFIDYSPSTDPNQGHPIIEREHINLITRHYDLNVVWCANPEFDQGNIISEGWTGPTALIAAMRAHIGNKLGNTVRIPEELV